MKALVWDDEELGAKFDVVDIPADLAEQADEYRHELVDVLSPVRRRRSSRSTSSDEERSPPTTSSGRIRNATIHDGLVPVLTGSAFKNKGVQPLLDAVVDYLPSPLDLPPIEGMDLKGKEELERKADVDEPFAALAFKIVADPHGKLTYFRVYSGQLEKGGRCSTPAPARRSGSAASSLMHANNREDLDAVCAGDIVAGIGLKDTRTGDTLSDEKAPIVLEELGSPSR